MTELEINGYIGMTEVDDIFKRLKILVVKMTMEVLEWHLKEYL